MNSSAACSCVPDRIEIWITQRKLLGATGNDSLYLVHFVSDNIAKRNGCIQEHTDIPSVAIAVL